MFNGVINIITEAEELSPGAKIATQVNHFGKLDIFAVNNSMNGNLSNRIFIGQSGFGGWDDEEKDAGEKSLLNNRYVEHPAGDEFGRYAVLSMIYEMK